MVYATNLGYPRIGPKRELKKALEAYWRGRATSAELLETARTLRKGNWELQHQLDLQHIPSNDFSLYDHVLDTIAMVGAVPRRYRWKGDRVDLDTYFAMARGVQSGVTGSEAVPAMDMTKWFDTNYHYIVPEFEPDQAFKLASTKAVDEFLEAKSLGIHTRPVLLGPVSFLLLGKSASVEFSPLTLLGQLLPVYAEILRQLAAAGANWVQLDEPCLVLDQGPRERQAYIVAYQQLGAVSPDLHILLATYFGDLGDNLETACKLNIDALHVDLLRAPGQLEPVLANLPEHLTLSLGVVDGRNVWRNDLSQALAQIKSAMQQLGSERIMVGPSCSLLFSPIDLDQETKLDEELRSWLAFARQKLEEIMLLTKAANQGVSSVQDSFEASRKAIAARRASSRIHNQVVKQRVADISPALLSRSTPHAERKRLQQEKLKLPLLPTTTIGSFPQTREVRKMRATFKKGAINGQEYEAFLKEEIRKTVRFQEDIGLDVLVHGEFERTDMVEYFGTQLEGFAFTTFGWVQSYGSRCVRPPIIYGDVSRPHPMTVEWAQYAQSLTDKPMKGMLTGPVTILQWSFVRDDQPRSETCNQIALAIRDEVADLERAGIQIIQIDEPAIREGLPLRQNGRQAYLTWAVNAFRLAASGVADTTQIHSHMCYSEINDIIESVGAFDADVIFIEASRSKMELLDAFRQYQYPNDIGPGVYDIHSPRVPSEDEVFGLLQRALGVLRSDQVWVNPDCGLKTRRWEEVEPSLTAMVAAARRVRASITAD
ncbi:MAG: 5-methyltetrahydropteroyltriglutamate--homocysteine S-methyltransferase [Candidatus Marinimicrobia bacterium]|nr:5-methyltetrahydropteroyltriglutamate--homocysteine S-methyltransferase [Candidatus Neomarinimicrobiota bacterium]